jgi:hypothetical protein
LDDLISFLIVKENQIAKEEGKEEWSFLTRMVEKVAKEKETITI